MRKMLLTTMLLALAFGLYAGANPDPPDVVIEITIPGAKVQEFRIGFLAMCPVPMIEDPNWIDDPNDPNDVPAIIPQYTEKKWIKVWIIRDLKRAYNHGKDKLAKQTAIKDPNVIE